MARSAGSSAVSDGRPAASPISERSARYGRAQANAASGAANGSAATAIDPAMPAHISAATRSPAIALVSGEAGLSAPNAATESGAVAASAAKPAATAPDAGGGAQRRRLSSKQGPRTASPATARYDSLNDSA